MPSLKIPEQDDLKLRIEIARRLVVEMRDETARHNARFLVVFLDARYPTMEAAIGKNNIDFLIAAIPVTMPRLRFGTRS